MPYLRLKRAFLYSIVSILAIQFIQCKRFSGTSKLHYGEVYLSQLDTSGCLCSGKKEGQRCIERMFGYIADTAQLARSEKAVKEKFLDERFGFGPFWGDTVPEAAALDETEKIALRGYTSDLYSEMNAALREGGEGWEEWKDIIYPAASGLNKLRPFWGLKKEVYRMESVPLAKIPQLMETYKKGNFVIEPSFLSTATEALPWRQYFGEMPIKYIIDGKNGVSIEQLSMFSHEAEVLFVPGTVFEVKSIEQITKEPSILDYKTPDEYIIIHLTEKNV